MDSLALPPEVTITHPIEEVAVTGTLQVIASPIECGSPIEAFPVLSSTNGSIGSHVPDDEQSRMAVAWDESMQKNWDIAEGYLRVGVLIIKWAKELDQMNCQDEVARLEALLSKKFNFETQMLELDVKKKPQLQLGQGVSNFVYEYDDSENRNLMIVYYSGHGQWNDEEGHLEFTADNNNEEPRKYKGGHAARAIWNNAEQPLLDADGDVLAIFDTCFASNLLKKGSMSDMRTYEFLAASRYDGLTEKPGQNSFTTALIDAFEDVLKDREGRPFTTAYLQQRIGERRIRNQPYLYNRLKRDDEHIRIAPLSTSDKKRKLSARPHNPDAGFLTLQFELDKAELNEEEIDSMTSCLGVAFKECKVKVNKVNWKNLRRRRNTRELFGKALRASSAISRFSHASQYHHTSDARILKRKHGSSAPGCLDPGHIKKRSASETLQTHSDWPHDSTRVERELNHVEEENLSPTSRHNNTRGRW